jgi:hypothetical protein
MPLVQEAKREALPAHVLVQEYFGARKVTTGVAVQLGHRLVQAR